jgi:hypothetical protein
MAIGISTGRRAIGRLLLCRDLSVLKIPSEAQLEEEGASLMD